jgi:hypothetical protein
MLSKKHASRSEKKKKRRIEGSIESKGGSIDICFKSNTSTTINPGEWAMV